MSQFVGRGQRSWFCKAGDDRGLISFRAVDAPLLPRLAELQRCTLHVQSCLQTSLQTSRQSPRCRLVAGPSKGHHHQQQHYSFVPDLPASATSSLPLQLSAPLLCKMPTVAQLKAQLAAKGLPTDGVKAVLEARLAAAVPAAAAPAQVDVAQLASLKRQLDLSRHCMSLP